VNIYEKNLEAIGKRTPIFKQWLPVQPGTEWVRLIKGDNGEYNLLIDTPKAPVTAYPNDDPSSRAKPEAEAHSRHDDSCTVVVGMGLGYLVKELLEVMDKKHVIVVVEPIAQILQLALQLQDFSKAIEDGSLLFAVTHEDVSYVMSLVEQGKNIEQWYVTMEHYTFQRKDEYQKLSEFVMQTISALRASTGTVMGAGHMIADNDVASLPYVIRHRGVAELEGMFKGKPAILVNTGPSLQKNIHHLMNTEVQDRFVIIAIGQALRVLLAYGIKPDFVTSVDYGPVNMGHYLGMLDVEDIPLVALNRSHAPMASVNLCGDLDLTMNNLLCRK
jgi:hypothetical protein